MKILMNTVTLVNGQLYAGTPIADPVEQAAVLSAGGVLGDTSNPAINSMYLVVSAQRQFGRGTPEMWAGMMQSVWAGGTSTGLVIEASITSGFADFAGLATGVKHFDYPLGPVLPSNARLLALPSAEGWTGFDDATHAVDQAEVGTTVGGAQLGALVAIDVTTGTGFPKPFAAGGYIGELIAAGTQMSVRISSTVDLKTLTAGALTVKVLYTLQP